MEEGTMRIGVWGAVLCAALVAAPAGAGAQGAIEGETLLLRDGARFGSEAVLFASEEAGDRGGDGLRSGEFVRASGAHRQPEPTKPRRVLLRRQRPNTVSVGFQGQYGATRGNSRVADGFDHGPGYAFRFRYMLSPSTALGFSFENQRYNSIQPSANVFGAFADSHVVITTVAAEGVFFRHRDRDLTPYLIGGFGFATPDIVFTEGQASRANEGLFAVVGAGFERFIRPRMSADVSIRGFALVSNSELTSMGQVSIGLHFYPGD
jgi:hypothetical protein